LGLRDALACEPPAAGGSLKELLDMARKIGKRRVGGASPFDPWLALGARSGGGFTLLELLVVVGVIGLLIGILLPALGGARRSARNVSCASNLRQWAWAVNVYAHQNHGYLPRRGNGWQPISSISRPTDWFNALPPLLKADRYYDLALAGKTPRPGRDSIWICPEAVDRGGIFFLGYAMNMALSTWEAPLPDAIDRVGPVGSMVFLTDGIGSYCSALPSAKAYSPVPRHGGGANIAFLDGHAAAFNGTYLGCGVGDPKRGDVRWHVPGSQWVGPPP
jgi:prepilin-type processing-associated H-X9-DG protein/prepilin-type N-terminal cleavage/methylation domain-containing protein